MNQAFIIDAIRSPMGRSKPDSAFAGVHPGDLLAQVLMRPATPGAIPPYEIDRVVGTHALLPIESGQELRWTMLG